MNTVSIIPAENGAMVRPYKSNPEFGFLQIQTSAMSLDGGWVREQKRTHLIKGSVEILEKFVALKANGDKLQGQIVVLECLANDIPADLAKRLNKDLTFEESIEPFIKRAGKDGVVLTQGGVAILRFTEYDPSGALTDRKVAHDNLEEVAQAKEQAKSDTAGE